MTARWDLLERMRALRTKSVDRFALISGSRLDQALTWRGSGSNLRFRFAHLAEADETLRGRIESLQMALSDQPRSALRALPALGGARGSLEGCLYGVAEQLFSQVPAAGEWPLVRILAHVIATDRRYLAAVKFARDRYESGRGGPLRPPAESLPPPGGESENFGTASERLQRLRLLRDEITTWIAELDDSVLDAPTNWVSWDLDIRFRIYRFAAHDREHAIQIRKALQALKFAPSEAQLLLADAAVARGGLEGTLLGVPESLLDVETGSGISIAGLLRAAMDEEQETLDLASV